MSSFAYILLHQASGMNGPPHELIVKAMSEAEGKLTNTIWSAPVYNKSDGRTRNATQRIFFTSPSGKRDDNFANRFAENLLMLCELFHGPLYRMTDKYFCFPFRTTKYKKGSGIFVETLGREIDYVIDDGHIVQTELLLREYNGISDHIVALALKASPLLQSDDGLRMATAFICKSHHDFHVFPGQLSEAISDGDRFPNGSYELAQWEAAFHNAYKAVEAVIGDPPKDETRFLAKMGAMGIDPSEKVGYSTKEPVSKVIRDMNRLRDTRAAHGSTKGRGIRLNEMVEFQQCGSYVVQCRIECLLPDIFRLYQKFAA